MRAGRARGRGGILLEVYVEWPVDATQFPETEEEEMWRSYRFQR